MRQISKVIGQKAVICLALILLVLASSALALLPVGRNSGLVLAQNALRVVGSMEWKQVWEGRYLSWTIGDWAYVVTATVTSGGSPISGVSVVADVIGPNGEAYWLRDGTQLLYDTVQGKGMDQSGWRIGPTYGGGTNDGIYANFLELDYTVDEGGGFFANHAGIWRIRLTASKEGYTSASTELTLNIPRKTGNFGHNFNFIDLDASTPTEDWEIRASPGQTFNAKIVYDETNPCAACCVFYMRAWGGPYEQWGNFSDVDSGCTGYRSNVERTWIYTVPTTPGIYTMTLANVLAYWWPFYGENVGFVGKVVVEEQVLNNPPYGPSNPSPATGATGVDIHADLSWTGGDPDSGDTVTYDVYFGTSSKPPLVSRKQAVIYYDPTLAYDTKYYWKIVATDSRGASTTGPLWDFTTGSVPNNPPNRPSNPWPANDAAGVSTNVELSWAGGDPDSGDTVTYDVYFGTSRNPPLVSNNQLGTTYDPGGLAHNTSYYWRVVATDNHGASTAGSTWHFVTITCPAPGPPTLLSPFNGQVGVSRTPTLAWSHASDVKAYIVQVSYAYSGGALVHSSTVKESQWRVSPVLEQGTQYLWRVQAVNDCGFGSWSSEWTFTTQTRPSTPFNASPASQETGVNLTPALQSSFFSDPDEGDSHAASQWQITTVPGDYSSPIFDSGTDTANLTRITIVSGILDYGTTYYWRVRYQDSYGNWSNWSEETQFTTQEPPSKGQSPLVLAGAILLAGTTLLGIIWGSTTVRMKRNMRRWEEEGYDLSDWR